MIYLSPCLGYLLEFCYIVVIGAWPLHFLSESLLFPRMTLNPKSDRRYYPLAAKWELRKPPLMVLYAENGQGIIFGGVTDEDEHEEILKSVFHNDLYRYQLSENGRWVSMLLKKPKQEKGRRRVCWCRRR